VATFDPDTNFSWGCSHIRLNPLGFIPCRVVEMRDQ
jgi:hypothetical protein